MVKVKRNGKNCQVGKTDPLGELGFGRDVQRGKVILARGAAKTILEIMRIHSLMELRTWAGGEEGENGREGWMGQFLLSVK